MQSLKAVVKNGRLVMDEPTELPEGTELVLAVIDDGDDWTTRSELDCTSRCAEASRKPRPDSSSMATKSSASCSRVDEAGLHARGGGAGRRSVFPEALHTDE
jgi:hypothetical protein